MIGPDLLIAIAIGGGASFAPAAVRWAVRCWRERHHIDWKVRAGYTVCSQLPDRPDRVYTDENWHRVRAHRDADHAQLAGLQFNPDWKLTYSNVDVLDARPVVAPVPVMLPGGLQMTVRDGDPSFLPVADPLDEQVAAGTLRRTFLEADELDARFPRRP